MKKSILVWLAVSSLFVKALWTLHPDMLLNSNNIPVYKMFPYSDIEISKPTYFFFLCEKSMWLIIIWTWKELMPEYQSALGALFLIQGLIFIEYFFNYNETQFWATIGNHRVPLDLSMAKLIVPTCILIYHQIWRGK